MNECIALSEAMKGAPNEPCKEHVHVNVIDKGDITTYKDGKTVCQVVVADAGECTRVFVYDQHNLQMFIKGCGLVMTDFIVKPGYLVVTQRSDVFGSSLVAILPETQERAEKLMGHVMTVMEVATSPKKTVVRGVEGVVVKTSDVEIKRKRTTQEELPFKRARLRDESGTVEVCLWRDLAQSQFQKGSYIRLKDFEVTDCLDSQNRSTPAICNKSSTSSLELLPQTDKYDNLLDLPEDLLEDDGPQIPPCTIVGFGPIHVYTSCPNETCYRKKVVNFKCSKCNVTYSEQTVQKSINGTLKVMGRPPLIYFTQQAYNMAKDLALEVDVTSDQFVRELVNKVPLQAIIKTKDNKVNSIKIIK